MLRRILERLIVCSTMGKVRLDGIIPSRMHLHTPSGISCILLFGAEGRTRVVLGLLEPTQAHAVERLPCGCCTGGLLLLPLDAQDEVYRGPKEVLTIGFDNDCIYRLKSIVREFNIVTDHDDGKLGFHSLDFRSHDSPVQQAQVELDHDRVYRLRHQKPQAFMTTACGHKTISELLQVKQFGRIAVDTQ
jgi:hypothetical protein